MRERIHFGRSAWVLILFKTGLGLIMTTTKHTHACSLQWFELKIINKDIR